MRPTKIINDDMGDPRYTWRGKKLQTRATV